MTRHLCPGHALLVATLLIGAGVHPVWAQDDEKELGWSDTAELTMVFTGGNAESSTFGFGNQLTRTWERSNLLVDVNTLRAESTMTTRSALATPTGFAVTESSVSNLTAANYYARGQYEHNITARTFWFGGTGWERNTFSGIAHRYVWTGGVGNTWIDSDSSTFKTTYGVSLTRQEDVVNTSGIQTFAGLRLGYDYRQQLTGNTEFTSGLVADQNLDDTDDFRADVVNALTVNMSSLLALTVRWRLLFDGQPSLIELPIVDAAGLPLGLTTSIAADEIDNFLTFALVASF